jgi:hypothetical protein
MILILLSLIRLKLETTVASCKAKSTKMAGKKSVADAPLNACQKNKSAT